MKEVHQRFNRHDDRGLDADMNVAYAWQSGHRPMQRANTYGLDGAFPTHLQPSLLWIYERVSVRWHTFLSQQNEHIPEETFTAEDEHLSQSLPSTIVRSPVKDIVGSEITPTHQNGLVKEASTTYKQRCSPATGSYYFRYCSTLATQWQHKEARAEDSTGISTTATARGQQLLTSRCYRGRISGTMVEVASTEEGLRCS
jgi:hypothetical protein